MKRNPENVLRSLTLFVFMFASFGPRLWAEVASGQKAPDFSLQDTKGQMRSLSEFSGKYVVLEWTNPDCPFVKKHYGSGNMQKLQSEAAAKGAVWLQIASSTEGKQGYYSAAEWNDINAKNASAAAALLLDPDGKTGRAYGAQTTPHMYLINSDGVLIYQGAIDDHPTPDPADIPNSVNYLSQALNEALQGKPVSVSATKSYGCSVKYAY
ncbi:MAG: hypothetical protein A2Z83_03165 [Omnitrophica bacterium GWA2_52_8]|nr:MAG: hypothetical protein A2Z83_03165 [Omnitrophica bacterium GWA2_52_8]